MFFCDQVEENSAHLFIKSKTAKKVWRELALEKEREKLELILGVHEMLESLWGLDENKRVQIFTFWCH